LRRGGTQDAPGRYFFNLKKSVHSMEIAGKVFIFTGGASGLGEGTARMLSANGGIVVNADKQAVPLKVAEVSSLIASAMQMVQAAKQAPAWSEWSCQ